MVFAALGLGGIGFGAVAALAPLSKYKGLFLLLTAGMLGLSYYLTYHKSNGSTLNKVIFWCSVALVLLMVLYTNRIYFTQWL